MLYRNVVTNATVLPGWFTEKAFSGTALTNVSVALLQNNTLKSISGHVQTRDNYNFTRQRRRSFRHHGTVNLH
jgi:hypothetical protein